MDIEDYTFEIFDSGKWLRIIPKGYKYLNSELDWDENWLVAKIEISLENFHGNYYADFMTVDFDNFEKWFSKLYENLNGFAEFHDLESYLNIKIKGDGIGHFEAKIEANDKPGYQNSTLAFYLNFDQTELPRMVNQLKKIKQKFPAIGSSSK